MGLRSHEYENTKHTPLALKTSSPHTIPITIPTHDKDGNQKYIGTLLSSQTTQSHHHTPP
ncbi:hypothetical protein BT095_10915 [Corynebacterium diphtheriae]|nr:hypothetical protein BT095_10915 [Corynebacterium diphtheriae]